MYQCIYIIFLLGRYTGAFVPCKIDAIIFWTLLFFHFFAINEICPAHFLAMLNSLFLGAKFNFHIGQWITAVKKNVKSFENILQMKIYTANITYVDAQPINGFSHRSRLSNSICHPEMLLVPLCITFFGGM